MSQAEVDRRLELATVHLGDSHAQGLSLCGRFDAAYGAARECSLAYAGATNLPVVYGDRRHRETLRYLIKGLSLGREVARTTDQMVTYHYLEAHLYYEGGCAIDEGIVAKAVPWADQLVLMTTRAIRERPTAPACA